MDEDSVILALTLYRECRGEIKEGQVAVANVIANRVKKNKSGFYIECVKPLQFSSLTSSGDSQLVVWPKLGDASYLQVRALAEDAVAGNLPDITNGATLYYAPKSIKSTKTLTHADGESLPFPMTWNPAAVSNPTVIGNHLFLKEI